MLLNTVAEGHGDRTIVLLHGMMGSTESWWRVSRRLAQHGRRALALDLPGHGLSFRDPRVSVESTAEAVIETVRAAASGSPAAWIGHSYGGTVLAEVATRIDVEHAVYVDTSCAFEGSPDAETVTAQYESGRRKRMDPARLRGSRPFYSETDAAVEARAALRFDPRTMAAVVSGAGYSGSPAPGSVLVRTEPSAFVSDVDAARFADRGVDVRTIPGAAHTVWYSHFEEFCAALPEVFA